MATPVAVTILVCTASLYKYTGKPSLRYLTDWIGTEKLLSGLIQGPYRKPIGKKVPLAHGKHVVMPTLGLDEPGGHATPADNPVVLQNAPGGHGML